MTEGSGALWLYLVTVWAAIAGIVLVAGWLWSKRRIREFALAWWPWKGRESHG